MNDIRIIRNKNELEGTAYIEILPATYKEKCWNEDSVFFDEEVFGYLEPILQKHVPTYDHYAFTEIGRDKWRAIIDDFEHLRSLLSSATSVADLHGRVGFRFGGTDERFGKEFRANKGALFVLVSEFTTWLRAKVIENESITILGI